MKRLAVLSLTLGLSTASLAADFGGISFHSQVPEEQTNALIKDVSYLYQTPVISSDEEFVSMTGLAQNDGPNMHNWLLNRVKYVVGESFELTEANIVVRPFHRFPSTPLPDAFSAMEGTEEVTTVMSNIGSAIYLVGKKENLLFGIRFDGDKLYAKSTRVGILQVGKGLFLERFRIHPDLNAPSNSVSRLGTLFHEARHSDGNSKHTGFLHVTCPTGHPYEGHAACETSSNGSYSLGALAERNLLKNCSACSDQEKTALSASVADAFNRVIDLDLYSKKLTLESRIRVTEGVIKMFIAQKDSSVSPEIAEIFQKEIEKLQNEIALLKEELLALKDVKPVVLPLDPNAEGDFKVISLKDSMKAMKKSLKR